MNKTSIPLQIAFILCMLFPAGAFAQLEKADKLFDNKNYREALGLYLNEQNLDSTNVRVMEKIGDCYFQLGEFKAAATYFKESYTLNPENDDLKIKYAGALINDYDLDPAELFLEAFLSVKPDNREASMLMQKIKSIREIQKKRINKYYLFSLENINTPDDDFAPATYGESALVFTSNHNTGLENFSDSTPASQHHNIIYIARLDKKDRKRFTGTEPYFHNLEADENIGPVSFIFKNDTAITAYFNAAEFDSGQTLKIYKSVFMHGKWSKPEGINLNSEKYSLRQPCISPDGKTLIFSSDLPGGYGGLDLYYSEFKNGQWDKPVNLGSMVNTKGNEAFPSLYTDGLYFSSNGHPGLGNYDIYKVINFKNPEEIYNLGYPLNSFADELSITFSAPNKGYFSSNRPGGLGGDDLYGFKRMLVKANTTMIKGIVDLGENKDPRKLKINLIDEDGIVLQSIYTDENGEFLFSEINPDNKYSFEVEVIEGDGILSPRIYVLNSDGEKVMALLQNINGEYTFEALKADEYDRLPKLQENSSLLTINLSGKVFLDTLGDLKKRLTVYVLNDNKQVIAKGYTDEEGNFSFDELPPQDQYTFVVSDTSNVNVVILKPGEKIIPLKYNGKNDEYYYNRLEPDEDFISVINESGNTVNILFNESFEIDNIYYDFNSWEINHDAAASLDRLVTLLKKNPHISIVLYSHTDSRGSRDFNMELSQKRADSAKKYLVSKGISAKRIQAVGMGESEPVNRCVDGVKCSEAEYAKNRRTEFKIIQD